MESFVDGPALVGSMHKHTNGYGFGARVPTSRNIPTYPVSVPEYRRPPLTPDSTMSSLNRNLRGHAANVRHAHQIEYQTSGDWGKFNFVKMSEAQTLNMDHIQPRTHERWSRPKTTSQIFHQKDELKTLSPVTGRVDKLKSFDFERRSDMKAYGSKILLDKTFHTNCRYDLIAAHQPMQSERGGQYSVQSNEYGFKKSLAWTQGLRK